MNQIFSDDKLDVFMQSAQLNFTEKKKKKIVTLKNFLVGMFIKLENKKQVFQDFIKSTKDFDKITAYQVDQQNGNITAKYKVKMFPRGQKQNQMVIALEDLTQIEELKLVKQKAKQADQHLQIFFEYFKSKFARIFHAIDVSCSMKIEDPMVELMQAKRITTKLYSTVQNIAGFRKQDSEEQGNYNAQRFSKRVRMKSLNPSCVSTFSFNNLIDDVKSIYPDVFSFRNNDTRSNTYSQNYIQIYSDIEKMKAIFITLFNQMEESLPQKYFKGVKVSFSEERETHFDYIKIQIQFQVHNDCIQSTQLKDVPYFLQDKEKKKIDSYEILKQLLSYYNPDNDEIRDIEIAMIKFYLSQISPYEMEIKEEAIEHDFQQVLSNSLIGNPQKDPNQTELESIKNIPQQNDMYYQISSNRQVDRMETSQKSLVSTNRQNEFENDQISQELAKNTNKRLNLDNDLSDNENNNNNNNNKYVSSNQNSHVQFTINNIPECKAEFEIPKRQSFKRVNQKKLSQFHRQTKTNSIDNKDYKNVLISITFFKDLRLILELNLRKNSQASNYNCQSNNNNNNNYNNNVLNLLDVKSRQNSTFSYNRTQNEINQLTAQYIPKISILKNNSMLGNQSPIINSNSPTYIKKIPKNNTLTTNINIFNSPQAIHSFTSIDEIPETKLNKIIPDFQVQTIKKLEQKINQIKQKLAQTTQKYVQKDNNQLVNV